ncbi:MAG: hypothetical protein A2Z25_24425 [Planctomycetes bacterium RBG_16_55_9]|nr:MAG: hypothetical protein A2Z25_24425 [Planctomycetes bacterium RBG_16_55_9]
MATFFIIGVKRGRGLSMREDGKAVKLEFWAVEKEQEDRPLSASLSALNCSSRRAEAGQKKVQGDMTSLPMHHSTTES